MFDNLSVLGTLLRRKTLPMMWRRKWGLIISLTMPIVVACMALSIFAPMLPSDADQPSYNSSKPLVDGVLAFDQVGDQGDKSVKINKSPRIFYALISNSSNATTLLEPTMQQLFRRIYGADPNGDKTRRFPNRTALSAALFSVQHLSALADLTIVLEDSSVSAGAGTNVSYEIQTSALYADGPSLDHGNDLKSAFNPVVAGFDVTLAEKGPATLQAWLLQALTTAVARTNVTFYANSSSSSSEAANPKWSYYPQPALADSESRTYTTRAARSNPAVRIVVPIFAALALFGSLAIATDFVCDKESGLRGFLLISAGGSSFPYLMSIILERLFISIVSTCLIIVIYSAIGIFDQSTFGLLLLVYVSAILACILAGYTLSTLFSSSRFSSFGSFLIYVGMIGCGSALAQATSATVSAKGATTFFLPAAGLVLSYDSILQLENTAGGLTTATLFSSVFSSPTAATAATESPSVGSLVLIMFGSTVFYYLLASYLEQVIPNEQMGIVRSPLFPIHWLLSLCRCGGEQSSSSSDGAGAGGAGASDNLVHGAAEVPRYGDSAAAAAATPVGSSKPLLSIHGLKKMYGDFVAVDWSKAEWPVTFHEGEIISLAAGNGGGKSQTAKMLMTLLTPTSGDATFFNPKNGEKYSLVKNPDKVREMVSLVPQHSIIIPLLSVRETMYLFAALRRAKNVDGHTIEKLATELGFQHKLDDPATTLSGGQKRLMEGACAFLGENSSVVFLDELTTGLSPVARRQCWELIRRMRKGRVIIWTTHYSDEAEILSDRIALLHRGSDFSGGGKPVLPPMPPLEVCRALGGGYTLRFYGVDSARHQAICDSVRAIVPSATPKRSVGTELVLHNIPFSAGPKIVDLLRFLEQSPEKENFTFEATTFEEAFLSLDDRISGSSGGTVTAAALGDAGDSEQNTLDALGTLAAAPGPRRLAEDNNNNNNDDDDGDGDQQRQQQQQHGVQQDRIIIPRQNSSPLLSAKSTRVFLVRHFWQLVATLYKRLCVTRRDFTSLLFTVVFPVVFAILGIVVFSASSTDTSGGGLHHAPWMVMDWTSAWTAPYSVAGITSSSSSSAAAAASLELLSEVAGNASAHTRCCYSDVVSSQLYNFSTPSASAWEIDMFNLSSGSGGEEAQLDVAVTFFLNPKKKMTLLQTQHNFFRGIILSQQQQQQQKVANLSGRLRPMPMNPLILNINAQLYLSLFIALSLAFVPASFAAFVVREKEETHSLSLQLSTGASRTILWIGQFGFDSLATLVFSGLLMIILRVGLASEEFAVENLFFFWKCVVIYILSCSMLTYNLSVFFERYARAQLSLALLFFGTVMMFTISWISVLGSTGSASAPARIITIVFAGISPLFGVVAALLLLLNTFGSRSGAMSYCDDTSFDSFCVSGWIPWMMGVQLGVYSAILLLQQVPVAHWWAAVTRACGCVGGCGCCICCCGPSNIDWGDADWEKREPADVKAEREAVERMMQQSGPSSDSGVVVAGIRQAFLKGTCKAIRGVSIQLPSRGCSAITGANGAGKSTLLRILMGQEIPTRGNAFIGGTSVLSHTHEIGYVPQHDQLLPEMTVEETIRHYALLKGVGACNEMGSLGSIVDAFVTHADLEQYRSVAVHKLSGGNRRKLSLAVALIGSPTVVFLDEISAGVDVVSRRKLIGMIEAAKERASVVLVSHSMEEVNILADQKMVLMSQGRALTCDYVPNVRKRFGEGFSLELTLKNPDDSLDVADFVRSRFGGAKRLEEHVLTASRQKWELPSSSSGKLSEIFEKLQDNKQIGTFSVAATSLENVFLQIISEKEHEQEIEAVEAADAASSAAASSGSFFGAAPAAVASSQAAPPPLSQAELLHQDEQPLAVASAASVDTNEQPQGKEDGGAPAEM